MNIYLISSLFVFSSLFSSDFAFRENIMPKEEAEFVLSFLPPQISSLPRRINAMNIGLRGSANAMLLLGEPGSGKSDAMEAVAALLDKDWSIHRIRESDLHQHAGARGDSTVQFNRLLGAMRENGGKNFIIMDELNGHLEHFNSEHHDTDLFSRAFWKMLDEHLEKPEYFLIASANAFDKVPQQIKDRLHDCTFEIDGFTTPEHLNACLVKIMSKAQNFHMVDGNNDYTIQRFTESGVRTARSTRSLMFSAFGEASTFAENFDHILVQRGHIDEAIARRARIDVRIKYGKPVETDQERYHRENKEMHERHHQENKEVHEREKKIDNLRADYNTFLSTISTYSATHRGLDIYREGKSTNSIHGEGSVHRVLMKGLAYTTAALEMKEDFDKQQPERMQQNQDVIQASGCSIQ